MNKTWRISVTFWLIIWISVFGAEIHSVMAEGGSVPYAKWMSLLLCIAGCFLVWSTPRHLFKNIDWELGVIVYAPAIYFILFASAQRYGTSSERVEILRSFLGASIAGLFAAAAAHWVARWQSNWAILQRTNLTNSLTMRALPSEGRILGISINNQKELPIKGAKVSVRIDYLKSDVVLSVPATGRPAFIQPHTVGRPSFEAVAWAEGDHPRKMDLAPTDETRSNLFEIWGHQFPAYVAVNSESSENRGSYRVVLRVRSNGPFTGYIKVTSDDTLSVIYPFVLDLRIDQDANHLGSPLTLGERLLVGELPPTPAI